MHLSHQPIVVVDDYDQLDGRFRNVSQLDNNTDAMALSIGRAQYDQDDLALKVWRISNNRWSRQSEELPVHRNLDLSILFVGALLNDGTDPPLTSLHEKIARYEYFGEIREFYEKDRANLKPRLEELRELIDRFLSRQ